jgi:hypothetical protein
VSLRLRTAVRDLLDQAELHGVITPGSPFAELRNLVRAEEREDDAPVSEHPHRRRVAQLAAALAGFRKSSAHFVGCPAQSAGGVCAPACRQAQVALDPDTAHEVRDEIGRLMTAIRGLEADRAGLRQQLSDRDQYWQRKIRGRRPDTTPQAHRRRRLTKKPAHVTRSRSHESTEQHAEPDRG